MKTKKITKKLSLNKETVASLNPVGMNQARGGASLFPDVCTKTSDLTDKVC